MAAYSTKDARLMMSWVDISAYVDTVSVKINAVTDPFHPLGATFPTTYDTGLRTGELAVTEIYDGASSQYRVAGSNYQTSLEVEGGTAGTRAYCFPDPIVSDHEVGIATDQMHRFTPGYTISGTVHNAFVVAPYDNRTTASNLDAADADGLAESTGATAFIHIGYIALGGYDNCIITPRDSADGITYADCSAAFAAVTATGAESIALTGTVDQYLSVSWAWTGSGSDQSITFAVYVARD